MPFEVGQSAADYEILGVLGKGGMGRVYRVRNIISNRIEAMKVLLSDVAAEAELGDRFIGEIRTLARLDHPNIAKFHTAFKVENQLVMVMEFVEGFTLSDEAKEHPIPLNEVLSYITQVLAALAYAHQNGVIHRDVKPSNIMVTPHGVVKLMDFGIAKSNAEPLLTRPGTTMGSMLYMSPEQVRGGAIDARSDLYSVGVVLYELTAGRRPFEAENTYAILEAQLNTVPKPPLEINPSLPQPLNEIIMTALAKEPMHRFQSAEAFRKALESVRPRDAAAQAQTISAPPNIRAVQPAAAAPSVLGSAPPRSHRGLWMALGAVACICVLIAAAFALPRFWRSSAAGKPTPPVTQSAPAAIPPTSAQPQPAQSVPAPSDSANTTAAASPPPAVSAPDRPNISGNQRVSEKPQVTHRASENSTVAPSTQQQPVAQPPAAQPAAAPTQYPPLAPQQAAPAPAGPSQEEMDKLDEDLMKLHARADAVKASLDNLRQQQAASGLGLRQDIAASASRLDSYLQAADRAVQSNNAQSARKHIQHAEEELGKLETFFGR